MNNLRKDQIIALASISGLFILLFFLVYFTYFTEKSESPKVAIKDNQDLPAVPETPNQIYDSRVDQAEQLRRENEKRKRVQQAKTEIDLNVFTKNETPKPPVEQPVVETVVEQPKPVQKTTTTQKKATKVRASKPPVQQTQAVQEYVDPDLMFADGSFTDESNTISYAPEPEEEDIGDRMIPGVVQDQVSITNGGRVTIRTTKDVVINGKSISRNSYIQTVAKFTKSRVSFVVPPIQCDDGTFLTESFTLYDADDNQPGLYSQALLDSELQKDQANDVASELANSANNPLVRSGLKSVTSAKIKEQKITLKRNQQVYLRIEE